MAAPKTILITAASGNIGRVLAPLLLTQTPAPKLVLPTASIDRLRECNTAANDVDAVLEEGSIRDPLWFESLLRTHNVEAVFLCVTGTDEMFTAFNCLDAISRVNSVKKVVYLSIVSDMVSVEGTKKLYRERGYPHIFAKAAVEQRLYHGEFNFSWTVLGPPVFFDNDLRLKPAMLQAGIYPEPIIAKGVSKVAVEDVALAATNAFFDSSGKWDSRKIPLGSKFAYSTYDSARLWSDALGKSLPTQTESEGRMEAYEQTLRKAFGSGLEGLAWARDLRVLFEHLTSHGAEISDDNYRLQVELLGREPEDYAAWAKKTAATWV